MKINIEIKRKKEIETTPTIKEKISFKLKELGCFYPITNINDNKHNTLILCDSGFANNQMFIKTAILQIILKDIIYIGGDEYMSLYLNLNSGCSWEMVWDKIKDIESLNYNIKE
jgi:hypothetical protein